MGETGMIGSLAGWRPAIAAVLVTATLSGCATNGIRGPSAFKSREVLARMSPAERQLQAEADRTWTSAGIGCLTGAILGAIIANANDQSAAGGAAIGCAGGAVVGVAGGEYLNARNRRYATAEQGYRARIAAADQDIVRYQRTNKTAELIIQEQQVKVSRLNQAYRGQRISAAQYRAEMVTARENVASLSKLNDQLRDNIRLLDEDINRYKSQGGNTRALEQRRRQLIQEKRSLESRIATLADLYNSVPPEIGVQV